MDTVEQRSLLERARTGDREAVQRIVMDEQRVVRSYLARLAPDPGAIDDLAQETFLAAFKAFDQIDPQRGLRGYLLGIARNLARQAWRLQEQRREVGGEAVFAALAARPQVESDDDDHRLASLARCLQRLSPRAAKIVELYYRDGLSCAAIAQAVTMGASSVRAVLARSRTALLECLGAGSGDRA